METCVLCKRELRYDFEINDGVCEECVIEGMSTASTKADQGCEPDDQGARINDGSPAS